MNVRPQARDYLRSQEHLYTDTHSHKGMLTIQDPRQRGYMQGVPSEIETRGQGQRCPFCDEYTDSVTAASLGFSCFSLILS